MKIYRVEFARDSDLYPQVRSFEATSAGHAQKKCLREYPGSRILKMWQEARLGEGGRCYGSITNEPVSAARVEPLPAVKTEERTFPFFDQCRGESTPRTV
jgi:hypothetical protein